jgi:hypothetical protein
MLVAIGVVYLLMVILFRSLLVPVVILYTLPLVVIGCFVSLAMTGRALDLSTLTGLRMQIGIIVTNAIVLLALVQHKVEAGDDVRTALLDPAHSPLRSYVDGGGLVVIGGPASYGVGGYTNTALDDVLPVSMRLPQRKGTPSVAVAPIIEDLATQSNVNISKVAGEGVINALRHTNARIKHVIVLGDGDAEDSYYEAARASLARGGTGALRAYVQALPDIQQALHGSVPASGLATDLYEDEQQNARETRSHAQIMRDALAKVNWQEIAEALREE